MTSYDHDVTMKAVGIADLKTHLSQHLREVRSGATLTVLDRNTPVARLVPIDDDDDLVVTRPAADAPPVGRIRLPPRAKIRVDVVSLLLKDRQRRR